LQVLLGLYNEALQKFEAAPPKADEILGLTDPARANVAPGERPRKAALVVVANAMLNLDEVITKN
jgi:hypothetical protein